MKQKIYGPPDSAKTLWYEASINRFADEDGYILQDLSEYFDTWQLDEWKKGKDYDILTDKTGELWEIFYNDARSINAELEICDHNCFECSAICRVYELIRN